MKQIASVLLLALVALLVPLSAADARPTYFLAMKSYFAVPDGSTVDGCIVCHLNYEGTGTRNPFGYLVQQYLYTGKSIQETLPLVAGLDSDNDGYINDDELRIYLTQPGFSCDNFEDARGEPLDFDSSVTPAVATCRAPVEIEALPSSAGFVTDAGTSDTFTIEVWNLGYSDDLTITDLNLSGLNNATLSLSNLPALPLVLAPGAVTSFEIIFSPAGTVASSGQVNIVSDDPAEPNITIPINALGVQRTLSSLEDRIACRESLQKNFATYSRLELRQSMNCFAREASNVRCAQARSDQKIARAELKLASFVGGEKDQLCLDAGITASRLDMPETCGGGCSDITLSGMASVYDCFICRQEEARNLALEATFAATPPDTPAGNSTPAVRKCIKSISKTVAKVIPAIQKELSECAGEKLADDEDDSGCITERASRIDQLRTKIDAAVAKCADVDDVPGCAFVDGADPTCLSDAATAAAESQVEAVWASY